MDWSSLPAILTLGVPSGTTLVMFWIALRNNLSSRKMVAESDARYTALANDRKRTEDGLRADIDAERARTDAARDRARVAEAKMDELLRRVSSLEAHILLLQQRVTELTAEVVGSISHDDA